MLGAAQVAGAALLLGIVELALLFWGPAPHPPWPAVLFVVGAWIYAVAGAVAWLRRPGSLMGLLMTAGAFAWLAAGLVNTTVATLIAIGLVVATIPIALVIHLLLAFPSGRLRGSDARAAVLAGYAVALLGQVPLYLSRRTARCRLRTGPTSSMPVTGWSARSGRSSCCRPACCSRAACAPSPRLGGACWRPCRYTGSSRCSSSRSPRRSATCSVIPWRRRRCSSQDRKLPKWTSAKVRAKSGSSPRPRSFTP